MEKTAMRAMRGEARGGQSTYVAFTFVFILLLALTLPIIEFTFMMKDQREVVSAASDMARFIAQDFDQNKTTEAQRAFLDQAYPAMSTAQFTVTYGPDITTAYEHHLPKKPNDPAGSGGGWVTRPSKTTSQEVDVTITLTRPWFTPMKAVLSLPLMGGSNGYTVKGTGSTNIDKTVAGGW